MNYFVCIFMVTSYNILCEVEFLPLFYRWETELRGFRNTVNVTFQRQADLDTPETTGCSILSNLGLGGKMEALVPYCAVASGWTTCPLHGLSSGTLGTCSFTQ